jgi:hypothetical protein
MQPRQDSHLPPLVAYNRDVLGQALVVIATYGGDKSPRYAGPVGAHLRHVIEHYDALLCPATAGIADYDSRPRSIALERRPDLAAGRVRALRQRLAALQRHDLTAPLVVRGRGGLGGEFDFAVESSLGRELAYVAMHAIHHFALLKTHAEQQGLALDADFGKAPVTVAHERLSSQPHSTLETSQCTTLPQAA